MRRLSYSLLFIIYYLLLKVAQDIVEFGPKLIESLKNT